MILVATLIAVVVIAALIMPLRDRGVLAAASAETDVNRLQETKESLVARYITDQKAASEGLITPREWDARKRFILSRYIDASRRVDHLTRALDVPPPQKDAKDNEEEVVDAEDS